MSRTGQSELGSLCRVRDFGITRKDILPLIAFLLFGALWIGLITRFLVSQGLPTRLIQLDT